MRYFALLIIFYCSLFAAEINRNLIAFYDSSKKDNERLNPIHESLEVILNYYGYIVDYADIQNPPKDLSKYYCAIFWFSDNLAKDPIKTVEYIANIKNQGIKLLWFGAIPLNDGTQNRQNEVNTILKEQFGFHIGDNWSDDGADIKIRSTVLKLNFEKKYGYLDGAHFLELIQDGSIKTLIESELVSEKIKSPAVFNSSWGTYAQDDKILFRDASDPQNQIKRWIVNPFIFVKQILLTEYPVPDVTTKNGKRVAYIHIDGDGASSKSEVIKNDICTDVYYQKIAKVYPFKTGVSFIVSELEKKSNAETVMAAKKIYALPYIEAASHTYTHPLSWSNAIVSFAKNPMSESAMHGGVHAHSVGKIDIAHEIKDSTEFINKLLPVGKSCKTIYWSGDCMPTKRDLEYVKEQNLSAFNGGDSFFDSTKPSYAYLYPLARDVNGTRQIYSTGSNENVYTNLWSDNFWGFARVIETFKNTGSPIRVMPINLYYHFYSLEKMASYRALDSVYKYLDSIKNDLSFIYPSEFIDSVNGFFDAKISVDGKKYEITNCAKLNTLRFSGKVAIKNGVGVQSVYYDAKQNVTYISINANSVSFEVSD